MISVPATLRLGRFSSSSVIPFSFVMPTTGGSPFMTNSHWPMIVQSQPLSQSTMRKKSDMSQILTRKLVSCQTESITDNLFVNETLELKANLVYSHSSSPMVERALSFAHTNLQVCILSVPVSTPN